jgi:hypothetical protein
VKKRVGCEMANHCNLILLSHCTKERRGDDLLCGQGNERREQQEEEEEKV